MSVSKLTSISGATAGDLQLIAQRYNRTVTCTQAYYVAHKDDPKSTSPFPDGCFIVVKDDTQSVMDGFVNQMYPVGSVYINGLVDTNPNTLFNTGTWIRIDGKFLYGTTDDGELETIGGATTVTLTQNNLPPTATFTIPSLSGSTDTADLSHIHTGTTDSTSIQHSHSGSIGDGLDIQTTSFVVDKSGSLQLGSVPFLNGENNVFKHSHSLTIGDMSQNATHTHTFSTGAMSANSTHSHTITTTSTSVTIADFGSGTAFSILPPYQKVNIWMRTL